MIEVSTKSQAQYLFHTRVLKILQVLSIMAFSGTEQERERDVVVLDTFDSFLELGFKSYRRYSTTFQMAVAVQFQNCTSLIVSGSNQKCRIWKKRNKEGVEIVAMILTLIRTLFWTFFVEHQWSSIIHYKWNWLQVLRSVDWRADSQKAKIGSCTLIVEMSGKAEEEKRPSNRDRNRQQS